MNIKNSKTSKTSFQQNIVNFITLSGGLALLDIRKFNPIQKEEIKKTAEKNGGIFLDLKFAEIEGALKDTIYDILIPSIPKDTVILLSNTEDLLEEALDNIMDLYPVDVDYKLIKD